MSPAAMFFEDEQILHNNPTNKQHLLPHTLQMLSGDAFHDIKS